MKDLLDKSIGLSVCLSVILLFSCGGSGSSDVSYLSLSKSSSDSFTISDVKSEQKYMLIPFAAGSKSDGQDPSGEIGYSVSFTTQSGSPKTISPDVSLKPKRPQKEIPEDIKKRFDDKAAFDRERHQKTKEIIDEVNGLIAGKPEGYFKTLYGDSLDEKYRSLFPNFALQNSLSVKFTIGPTTYNVTGTLRREGTNAAVYVDNDYTAQVTNSDVEAVLNTFDNITYKRVRAFWGEESDIDGNGKVLIFLTDIKAITGMAIVGFFQPCDLVPSTVSGCENSNGAEIIFSTYPLAGGDARFYKELIDATFAHEFFHLINFVEKYMNLFYGGSGVAESLFLNEGMAHLTEDITGHGYDAFHTARYYLDYVPLASIAGSVDASLKGGGYDPDDTLYRRAATMLFLRYLFERKGGAKYSKTDPGDVKGGGVDFLRRLNSSRRTGIKNIEETYGTSFERLFRQWVAALYLDGTGINNDEIFNYGPEENDNFTNQIRGFNLRGSRALPTGKETLYGPDVTRTITTQWGLQNFSDTVFDSGAEFFTLEVSPLRELKITMSGTKGLGLGMTIVRIQ